MKKLNNNKIIPIGILLIGVSFFYYFIIAPIVADNKLKSCINRVELGGYAVYEKNNDNKFNIPKAHNYSKERDLCFKLYK